jgi:hypothetical protein
MTVNMWLLPAVVAAEETSPEVLVVVVPAVIEVT